MADIDENAIALFMRIMIPGGEDLGADDEAREITATACPHPVAVTRRAVGGDQVDIVGHRKIGLDIEADLAADVAAAVAIEAVGRRQLMPLVIETGIAAQGKGREHLLVAEHGFEPGVVAIDPALAGHGGGIAILAAEADHAGNEAVTVGVLAEMLRNAGVAVPRMLTGIDANENPGLVAFGLGLSPQQGTRQQQRKHGLESHIQYPRTT